jgi:5-formyltetrahydrofolate cyclo-ligase
MSDPTPTSPGTATAKAAMRRAALERRRSMSATERRRAADRLLAALPAALPTLDGLTVAAYYPVGTEPGGPLPRSLTDAGHRVLLPVLLPDNDLDWALMDGTPPAAGRGLREPDGPRLGPAAISSADAIIVPALAVSEFGDRLGRGGGSYDRALARVAGEIPVIALLYDGEWPLSIPLDSHDRPVNRVVTPRAGAVQVRSRHR